MKQPKPLRATAEAIRKKTYNPKIKKMEKILYAIAETGCYGGYNKNNKNCNEKNPNPICLLCKEFSHKSQRSKADVFKYWQELKKGG